MASQFFTQIPEFKIVCCQQCKHAVWPREIVKHLRGEHHIVKRKVAIAIEDEIKGWSNVGLTIRQVSIPSHIEKPIDGLEIFRDGLMCDVEGSDCRYIARKEGSIRQHLTNKHPGVRGKHGGKRGRPGVANSNEEDSKPWKRVVCQRFFASREGSQYFQVEDPDDEDEPITPAPSSRIEQARQALIRREAIVDDKTRTINEGQQDEANPWLKRTGWAGYLSGIDREKLIEVIREPDPRQEPVAYKIWQAMEQLASKCQETVATRVGHFTRMEAVRVEATQTKYQPLMPYMDRKEIKRYALPWKKVMMFVVRTQQSHDWESPKYKMDRREADGFEELKYIAVREAMQDDDMASVDSQASNEFSDVDVSDSERPGTGQSDRQAAEENGQVTGLHRAILKFCLALLARQTRKTEHDSVLVCALAVLGVDEQGWKNASNFPPELSKLIKVARFMVIQQAWQVVGGAEEGDEDRDGCVQLVKKMVDRFMIRGTHGAMDWMLDLRTYGLKIHYNTTAGGNVDWVGEEIRYKKVEFSMQRLRETIKDTARETSKVLFEQVMSIGMRREVPRIPWTKLRDDPTRSELGWNFVRDERNAWPVDGQWWLFERLTGPKSKHRLIRGEIYEGNIWDARGIDRWMDSVVEFREKLLFLVHVTGGQPARGPEILSVRHANTATGEHRNVFVENGKVVIVTRYHKGYAISGDVKVIHRYLPREIGELVVYYLWLVLPLQRRLYAEMGQKDTWSNHLWPVTEEKKEWNAVRMAAVLRRETRQLCDEGLGLAAWREVAIAISRRFMRGKQRFSYDDDDEDGEGGEDLIEDLQAGHGSHVAGMIYARGVREMSGEVVRKRDLFRKASEEWQEFLGLGEKEERTGEKRARALYEDRAGSGPYERWKAARRLELREKLKEMMGEESEFRGIQEQALKSILDGTPRVLVVMSTGGGKSLMFMLPAWLRTGGVSIVVVPLIALRQDMLRRCKELGIRCEAFEARKTSYEGDLILVTPESALSDGFATLMNSLKGSGRLDRIVIDECHVMLNDKQDFRPKLQKLGQLNRAGVQIVMLTATLPPSKEVSFFERAWVTREQVSIFRARTSRSNIEYRRFRRQATRQEDREEELRGFLRAESERVREEGGVMVVYSNRVEEAKRMAEDLRCEAYFHEEKEKSRILDGIVRGEQQVVVATSAFGMGIDVKDIRVIVHVHRPRSLIEYGQESGRAGRDGMKSRAWVVDFSTRAGLQDRGGRELTESEKVEEGWVDRLMEEGCVREVLDEYLDGREDRDGCEEVEESCDSCKIGEEEQQREEEVRQEWERREELQSRIREDYTGEVRRQGWLMEKGKAKVGELAGRCVWCRERGFIGEHLLFWCREDGSGRARELYRQLKGEIRGKRLLNKYGGCDFCFAPYEWCDRWKESEEHSGLWEVKREVKRCRLEDVILGEICRRISESEVYGQGLAERIQKEGFGEVEDGNWAEKMGKYLGKRVEWGGYETRMMVREFVEFE